MADKMKSNLELLRSPLMMKRFVGFAGEGKGERLFKMAALAVSRNDLLQQAPAVDLVQAMMFVTGLGLEINSPKAQAFLIPFKDTRNDKITIQIIIGYKGFVQLIEDAGGHMLHADVATINEHVAKLFQYQYGTEEYLRHVYDPARDEDKDAAAYAYAVFQYADGKKKFRVVPWSKIEKIRNGSQGYRYALSRGKDSIQYKTSPWVTNPFEMAAKTAIRAGAKTMPLNEKLAKAIDVDEAGERQDGVDLSSIVDLDPTDWEEMQPEGAAARAETVKDPVEQTTAHADQAAPKQEKPKQTRKNTKAAEPAGDPRREPPAEDAPQTGQSEAPREEAKPTARRGSTAADDWGDE